MNNQRSKSSTEGKRRSRGRARLNIRMSTETAAQLQVLSAQRTHSSLGETVAYLLRLERECGRVA